MEICFLQLPREEDESSPEKRIKHTIRSWIAPDLSCVLKALLDYFKVGSVEEVDLQKECGGIDLT